MSVVVTNADGQAATLAAAFTYGAPVDVAPLPQASAPKGLGMVPVERTRVSLLADPFPIWANPWTLEGDLSPSPSPPARASPTSSTTRPPAAR